MHETFWFTPETLAQKAIDRELIRNRLAVKLRAQDRSRSFFGRFRISSDQRHDQQSVQDMEDRECERLGRDLLQIDHEISQARIAPDPLDTSVLRIGHLATVDLYDMEWDEIGTVVCKVGGYGDIDTEAKPPIIPYTAPLICKFIGKSVVDAFDVPIRVPYQGRLCYAELSKIAFSLDELDLTGFEKPTGSVVLIRSSAA